MQNEVDAYRKIRLRCEEVQGKNVLTNFWVSITAIRSQLKAARGFPAGLAACIDLHMR